jgi:phosphate uptake regulator
MKKEIQKQNTSTLKEIDKHNKKIEKEVEKKLADDLMKITNKYISYCKKINKDYNKKNIN